MVEGAQASPMAVTEASPGRGPIAAPVQQAAIERLLGQAGGHQQHRLRRSSRRRPVKTQAVETPPRSIRATA